MSYESGVWDDFNLPIIALSNPSATPSTVTLGGSGGILVYAFDGSGGTDKLYGIIELLHGYKEGSDLRPHIHWAPQTANSGDVQWTLEYAAQVGGATPSNTIITAVQAAGGVAWAHQHVEFPVISGTGLKIGTQISFAISRVSGNPADTYADDAIPFSIGVHYQRDSLGSIGVFTKETY